MQPDETPRDEAIIRHKTKKDKVEYVELGHLTRPYRPKLSRMSRDFYFWDEIDTIPNYPIKDLRRDRHFWNIDLETVSRQKPQ